MPQSYTPEFKKKSYVFMKKKVVLTKASLLSMGFPKTASLSGAANSVKNAKSKPLKIQTRRMKWNLRLRKELEEVKKENLFLKKAAVFFAKEID